MNTIAKALVIAVQYIADRDDEDSEDDDIDLLDEVAEMIQGVSDAERAALIAAANELELPDWPMQIGLVPEKS